VVGSNETPIEFEEKKLSVTVEMVEDKSGDRVPHMRPAGLILQDGISTKYAW